MAFPGTFPTALHAPSLYALTLVASATNEGASITGPAAIQAGDLLVLWDHAADDSAIPDSAVPSGFSIIQDFSGFAAFAFRQILSFKIATGAEASSPLSGLSGDVFSAKCLYVFRGNRPLQVAAAFDSASQFTEGNPSPQTVNAAGAAAPLVVLGAYAAVVAIDPRSFTPAKDGEINVLGFVWLAYKIYNLDPQDVVVDMDDEGTSALASCYIQCS
jgi:hypothetical protein